MKKIIFGILAMAFMVFAFFIIEIPSYVELNNLMIVEGIGVSCEEDGYKLYLREIIPTKEDAGITYKYKIYGSEGVKSLNEAYRGIEKEENKKIFYKDCRIIITDCSESKKIVKHFDIKPNTILHTSDVLKKLEK